MAADDADFDGNGIPNLVEYAAGSCPTRAETPVRLDVSQGDLPLLASDGGGGYVTLNILQACNSLSGL